jgi:DNA-binding beta-propeller fold protein YncE
MATNTAGDLYIADAGNEVVEEVTPSGRLHVVAGDGRAGVPTPGPATRSALQGPDSVAVNRAGDLFIADSFNQRVEEVTPSGRLSVFAGDGQTGAPTPGPAARSALDEPSWLAFGPNGDLYLSDSGNSLVEKVTPAGQLSVVAGDGKFGPPSPGPATGSALDQPSGLAVGPNGDLYIADPGNHVVEQVTPAGRLSVLAGQVGLSGAPVAGPAAASALAAPTGLAVDGQGDLFIADSGNNVVVEVAASGALSVVAGDGKQGQPSPGPAGASALDKPTGLVARPQGGLFIADSGNNVVEELSPTGELSVVAGVAGNTGPPTVGPARRSALSSPDGVAVNLAGDLFIADSGNDVVEEVGPEGDLSVVAGDGKQGRPRAGPATSSRLDGPSGVAVSPSGDVYIADSGNNDIVEVTASDQLRVVAGVPGQHGLPTPGPAARSRLDDPSGLAVGPGGDLYIADSLNNLIERVNPSGELSIVAGNGEQGTPTTGLAVRSRLHWPTSVAFDADEDMFIADSRNDAVEKVSPAGLLSVVAGLPGQAGPETPGPAAQSRLDWPTGVAADGQGYVFVADSENDVVAAVSPVGTLSVVAGNGQEGFPTPGPALASAFSFPAGLAVGRDGDLYIADLVNDDVEEVSPGAAGTGG